MCTSTVWAFLRRFFRNYEFTALITVISRNSVSPPDLTGDTPVFDVLKPVKVNLVKTLRYETKFTGLQCVDRRFCKLIHLYKPLLFDQRLNGCTTTVMCSYCMHVRNNLYKVSLLIKISYDCFSRLVTIHSCVFSALLVNCCIIVHDIDFRKVMTLSYFEIVRVMCRCDLNSTCSEFFVYIIVCNDRNLTIYKRKDCHLSYDIFVSLIIRVNGDCCISKQCLRTCCCNLKETVCSGDRVLNMPEVSVLILMLYLCV